MALCAVSLGSVNPQMAHSQPKSPLWSNQIEKQSEEKEKKQIPCLNSSNECVEQLTVRAIANSPKLQQSESRIALIEQRLAVTEDRIDYTSKKKWTNYISTNPVNIIQNLCLVVVGYREIILRSPILKSELQTYWQLKPNWSDSKKKRN